MNKQEIIEEMSVKHHIDAHHEIKARVEFIKQTLVSSGAQALVLGISGGIDSTTLGKLAQRAIDEMNQTNSGYEFFAIRLPYGTQADEADAQQALDFIRPSKTLDVDIKPGVDKLHLASLSALDSAQKTTLKDNQIDFAKGNLKARARMAVQYEIAGLVAGLVLGTDHSAENVTGFYTKWGDGACDLAPLFGLSKRQVRQLARELGAPDELICKPPTADLECLQPAKTDESALGLSYQQIDDFLEGQSTDDKADSLLINLFNKTQHKRQPIPTPDSV